MVKVHVVGQPDQDKEAHLRRKRAGVEVLQTLALLRTAPGSIFTSPAEDARVHELPANSSGRVQDSVTWLSAGRTQPYVEWKGLERTR